MLIAVFFFFKQKTAYEVRISDWSSDVCSSDLGTSYLVGKSDTVVEVSARLVDLRDGQLLWQGSAKASSAESRGNQSSLAGILLQTVVEQIADTVSDQGNVIAGVASQRLLAPRSQIGRASCGERVCQYV